MTTSSSPKGPVDRMIEASLSAYDVANSLLIAALDRKISSRAVKNYTREQLSRKAEPLLNVVDYTHIGREMLRRIERNGLSVRRALSYRAQMVERSEARRFAGVRPPTSELVTKNRAYDFLDQLDVRRPQTDKRVFQFKQLPADVPAVIKPVHGTGAKGCYLIYQDDYVVHVRDGLVLRSIDELATHAAQLMRPAENSRAHPVSDKWMIEELVLEDPDNLTPGRDLKFYTFYGEVLMILEIVRNQGPNQYCYWSADGTRIDQPGSWDRQQFPGDGVTREQVAEVERISREIPSPFMRIDMLKGQNELVFGEFTPSTGEYELFNEEFDRILGEAWVRAESRLLQDMLRGKRFDAFLAATRFLDNSSEE